MTMKLEHHLVSSLLAVLLVLAPLWAEAAAPPRDPYEYFFDQTLGDFSEELLAAKEQGKRGILLFFEMDECPFCHRMKNTVLNQVQVQDYFKKHFLSFPVDIEGDTEITDFAGNAMRAKDFAFKVNRVRATPVFAFYDLEGNRVVRYTGATAGIDEFMWLGEYFVNGVYQRMNFTKYKREKMQSPKE